MLKAGALIVGLLIALALTASVAWYAGEAHYDNCVRTAKTMHNGESTQDYWGKDDPLQLTEEQAQRERRNAVAGCSRTPW